MRKIDPKMKLEDVAIRLGEECSEVIKEIFKGQRFGFDTEWRNATPLERLITEVQDVKKCIKAFEKALRNG